jgi:hypothetical protein
VGDHTFILWLSWSEHVLAVRFDAAPAVQKAWKLKLGFSLAYDGVMLTSRQGR